MCSGDVRHTGNLSMLGSAVVAVIEAKQIEEKIGWGCLPRMQGKIGGGNNTMNQDIRNQSCIMNHSRRSLSLRPKKT